MKFIQKLIEKYRPTFLINNITLSKDHPTVVYVPIGSMPIQKAQEYLERVMEQKVKSCGDEYKVIWIAVRD